MSFHSNETRELAETLNTDIQQLLNDRKALDASLSAARETDVGTVDYVTLRSTEDAQSRRFELLQRELKLRERLRTFFSREAADGSAAVGALSETLADLPAQIGQRLESIGYLPFNNAKPTAGAWNPEMIQRHPEVLSLRGEINAIRNQSNNSGHGPENLKCLEDCRRMLEQLRLNIISNA